MKLLQQDDIRELEQHKLEAVAMDQVTLFRFPAHQIAKIASHPATRLMWKELFMENLLRIVQRYFARRHHKNEPSDTVNPLFLPLQDHELPDPMRAGSGVALSNSFKHVGKSMIWSFTPPWPVKGFPMGLRHRLSAPGKAGAV